jgi:hypothetical protein
MTQPEFLEWVEFYKLYPFDDYHRYFRPAALIAGAFGGNTQDALDARLNWLQPTPTTGYSEADLNTFKALGMPRPPPRG